MRRTAATVMVAAGFLGAVAAPATAGKTHGLVGEFDGDPGSSVSMKVKVNHGKPKFVKDIRLSGLEMACDPLDPLNPVPIIRDSGREEFPGKIRVKAGTKPPEYSKVLVNEAVSQLDVTGTLRKKGKLSTGEMDLTQGAGTGACFGGGTFEASKE
jgi:hypothetical protein